MKWNPFINALSASVYIGAVATFMQFIASLRHDTPDTLLDSMGAMSLFVCSAAVMAFLFFYQPVVMLMDHRRAEAVSYFLKTIAIFGAITVSILTVVSMQ